MATRTHWGAVGDVAASRHGVFHRTQAAELDLSPKVIRALRRSGHLAEPAPGVLVVAGSPDTWQRRLEVATRAAGGVAAVAFAAAAALNGLEGYGHTTTDLLVPSWRRQLTSIARIHIGPIDECDFVEIQGWRCTNIARTLCDTAAVDPLHRVRPAFESAWRSGSSLVWIRRTAARLHRPGKHGTRVILDLLDEAGRHRRPTGSRLELDLADILHGIDGLVRQHSIYTPAGAFVARPDLAVPEARLAVEVGVQQFAGRTASQ